VGENVTVEPLLFTEDELDAQAFLSMMAVESSGSAPLYMQVFLVGGPYLFIPATLIYDGPEYPQGVGGRLHLREIPGEARDAM
jgi:hypothetical protein